MLNMGGKFRWEIEDVDGRIRDSGEFHNGITTEGVNDILDVYFRNGSTASNWYMGLISSTDYTALDEDDTMASHSGWTEDENYSQAARLEWAPSAATSGFLDNATAVKFTMNAVTTINGLFIVDDNTKGGVAGTLWATGLLETAKAVKSGEIFRAWYDLTGKEG